MEKDAKTLDAELAANGIKDAELAANVGGMSSVLYFSKMGSEFVDADFSSGSSNAITHNKHDYTRGVDVRLSDEYILNGEDNYLPFKLRKVVTQSTIQKRAFNTISNVASGKFIFTDPATGLTVKPDREKELKQIYKDLGITNRLFIKPTVCSAYLNGGSPAVMAFNSNGREFVLSRVAKKDYKTFRLGKPSMLNGETVHDRHYYHRNWGYNEVRKGKKIKVDKKVLSWVKWAKNAEKNYDKVSYIPSYNPDRKLSNEVNRSQSYFIKADDGLTDYYPFPVWFSGASYNYIKADFLISCFDVDEIENGFHASGYVKVYHKAYKNPESGEAKDTFEQHKKLVEQKLRGSYNSGSITIVPVGIDGNPTNDFMEFVETPSSSKKYRHEILDKRIKKNILSANGAIYSELFGIQGDKSTLSEGNGDKLITGLKILNEFTIKPLKELLDSDDGGFLNLVNDLLGIEERTVIVPNLSAFLSISPDLAKHFLHPEMWYDMYRSFGLAAPTAEQIADGLIPAYASNKKSKKSKK